MLWESENRAEQCRILQIGTVDAGNGTLFGTRNKRAIQRDHLTLVIGSGGMGAATIHAAVQKARQNLESDFDNYTKFILVDSDWREIARMEKEQVEVLNISTPGASYRLRKENRGDFFKKFVHPDYDVIKLGPNGSARDRVTGKIKFYDNAEGGSTNDVKFRNIIQTIFNTDWSDKTNLRVDVMILAGLSGGNGSGTFEELAVHAREACRRAGATEVRVFGYLFLPDTVEAFERENLEALKSIYINGYSALKELESYMSIPASPGRGEEFYSRDGAITIECNDANRLFDYPILISGTYEESIRMMADLIVNLSTSGIAGMDSFYATIWRARLYYLNGNNLTTGGVLKNNVFPEDSRRYCGIGYAYAAIPKEIVTANIVGNVCQKFYQTDETGRHFCTEKKRMNRAEMETQIRRLFGFGTHDELNEMSLWNLKLRYALERCSRLSDNPVGITRRDVETGNTYTYERGFRAEECTLKGISEFAEYFTDQVRFFKENARQIIKDYGPKAIELLYKGTGPYNQDGMSEAYPELSIENMLNTAKAEMQRVIATTVARPELIIGFMESIRRSGLIQWKDEFQHAIQHEVKQEIARRILEPDGIWESRLIKPIEEFINQCRCFSNRLDTLIRFYRSVGSSLDGDYQRFLNESQRENGINLCNNVQAYGWIQENIRKKMMGIDLEGVKRNLVASFTENSEDWASNEEGRTRKVFDEVMARSCELGISGAANQLTATSYFEHVLEQEPQENVANKARELVQGIVRQLIEKSKPTLKTVPESWSAIAGFLFLPAELAYSKFTTPIQQAFRDEFARIRDVRYSCLLADVSDIICYQVSEANALCDLKDIGKWEDFYNSSYYTISRHLCNGEYVTKFTERTKSEIEEEKARKEQKPVPELRLTAQEEFLFGTGLNWEHYPPVALRNLESNEKEKEFLRTIFDPIVDYAMKERLIERKINQMGNRDVYEYVVHLIPDDWNNLDVEDYENIEQDGKFSKGKELFDYLKQHNRCSTQPDQKPVILSDSGIFAGPFDFSNARQCGMSSDEIEKQSIVYMKRILRKNTELFLEFRETLCRYYEIKKALELREEDQRYKYQVKHFIRYYQYGVVVYSEKDMTWRYMINNEGRMKTLCRFDGIAEINYTPIEKKFSQMNWKILMAFKTFTALNFDELECIAKEKEISEDRNELNTLLRKNGEKLRKLGKKLKTDFIDPAGEDRTPEEAIKFCLRIRNGNDDEEFYVKTLVNMYESLEEFTSFIEPVPVPEEWVCSYGHHNLENHCFCSVCGEKRGWKCESCGHYHNNKIRFCPECGARAPMK